jgi:hypothetical protein
VACINLSLPQSKKFFAKRFTVAWGPLHKFHTRLTVNYISAFLNFLLSFIITFNDVLVRWGIFIILYAMMAVVLIIIINLWLGVPGE